MGYSRSLATVARRESLLRPLFARAPEIRWHFTYDEAPRRASQIRECFAIARAKPHELPVLAVLACEYSIFVEGSSVVARRKVDEPDPRTLTAERPMLTRERSPERVLPDVDTIEKAIQAWIDQGIEPIPLVFPNLELTPRSTKELRTFAENMTPALEVLVNSQGHVFLRAKEVS